MNQFWNERYADAQFAYGTAPNVFFKEQIDQLPAGRILLIAEGEGRNGVYAAKQGWSVVANDFSPEGKEKALKLADTEGVSFSAYIVGNAAELAFEENSFDAIGLIYAHLPPNVRKIVYQNAGKWLKKGGTLILEAFNKAQVNYTSGGPRDAAMLFDETMLKEDFEGLDIVLMNNEIITLDEGLYHQGAGSVIRFIGKKI